MAGQALSDQQLKDRAGGGSGKFQGQDLLADFEAATQGVSEDYKKQLRSALGVTYMPSAQNKAASPKPSTQQPAPLQGLQEAAPVVPYPVQQSPMQGGPTPTPEGVPSSTPQPPAWATGATQGLQNALPSGIQHISEGRPAPIDMSTQRRGPMTGGMGSPSNKYQTLY